MVGAMTDYNDMAQRYIDTWNATDPAARRAAVDQLYTEDARYVDPLGAADGREAIAAVIGAVQQQFPGFSFRLAGPVDGHHNQARFGWELGPVGAEAPIVGFDVAVSDDAGRIQTVLGFLDKVPAAA
jgi:SnoaL-like domain